MRARRCSASAGQSCGVGQQRLEAGDRGRVVRIDLEDLAIRRDRVVRLLEHVALQLGALVQQLDAALIAVVAIGLLAIQLQQLLVRRGLAIRGLEAVEALDIARVEGQRLLEQLRGAVMVADALGVDAPGVLRRARAIASSISTASSSSGLPRILPRRFHCPPTLASRVSVSQVSSSRGSSRNKPRVHVDRAVEVFQLVLVDLAEARQQSLALLDVLLALDARLERRRSASATACAPGRSARAPRRPARAFHPRPP